MNEAQFQNTVIDLAQTLGWRVHVERPARKKDGTWVTPIQGDPGFPDLLMIRLRDGRCVVAEIKSEKGRLSELQAEWLCAFGDAGVKYYVWRPQDLGPTVEESVIMEVLR